VLIGVLVARQHWHAVAPERAVRIAGPS